MLARICVIELSVSSTAAARSESTASRLTLDSLSLIMMSWIFLINSLNPFTTAPISLLCVTSIRRLKSALPFAIPSIVPTTTLNGFKETVSITERTIRMINAITRLPIISATRR